MTSLGSGAELPERSRALARGDQELGTAHVQLGVAGGTDLGSDMPAYESFTLGGPLRLSGLPLNQFAGREYCVRPR